MSVDFVCSLVKLWESQSKYEPIVDDLKVGQPGDQVYIQCFQNYLACLNRIKRVRAKQGIQFRCEEYKESEVTEVFMAKKHF